MQEQSALEMSSSFRRTVRLIVSVVLCESAGAVGSAFTIPAIPTWYAGLAKPAFTPPSWLFGPVWVTLYLLMGVALYSLLQKGAQGKTAIIAFGVQLILNILWSAVFFGLHLLFGGFVVIAALWAAVAVTIALSYRVSRIAGTLLIPYIVWVTIASSLNYYVWVLNP